MAKRSTKVALTILGAAAFTLAGCREEQTDARAFPDEASCMAAAREGAGWFTEADCTETFAQAQATHLETAPRYESRELCEAEHGPEACATDPAASASGGGFSFMPLLAGYMIGSMLGGGRGMASQPLVKTPGGGFATPDGGTKLSSNTGAGKMATSAFAKAPATIGKPPMSSADVARRGGFGASAAGRATSGG